MKLSIYVGMLLMSFSSFSAELMPAGHSTCLNNSAESCTEGTELYTDQNGRCGCLTPDEFIPIRTCMVATIGCDTQNGEFFSTLHTQRQMCGLTQNVEVGCGCFTMAEGMFAS